MSSSKFFDSKTNPIPEIRRDIQIFPVRENGNEYLYFHDQMGYATPNFALDKQVEGLLSLLDGRNSINELKPYLGDNVTTDKLLEYVQFLDENRLLRSSYFKEYAEQVEQEYEVSDTHLSVTAGESYPADPDELKTFLDEAFSQIQAPSVEGQPAEIKALYAPHIDPRVGMESYAKAFSAIRHLQPKRVVIIATSHYAGLHPDTYDNKPFVAVDKDFELPLGTIPSDSKSMEQLLEKGDGSGITEKDRAHRMEHSIELHLLFLSYLWNHSFKVVPILVNGFEDLFYAEESYRAKQIETFAKQMQQFSSDKDTFFLISGDLAHIGKKFGDRQPAQTMFEEVRKFDKSFLDHATESNTKEMLNLVKKDYDPYRICGFPPLYTFLKSRPDLTGQTLTYDLWDEQERESAVSFGSILYGDQ